jgi:hypothetical protein
LLGPQLPHQKQKEKNSKTVNQKTLDKLKRKILPKGWETITWGNC